MSIANERLHILANAALSKLMGRQLTMDFHEEAANDALQVLERLRL